MTQKIEKPLILVDGSSYLYRAFHAMPSLSNSKGFPTGAVYGIVNMLRKLLDDYDPEYMAVVFDSKGKTFRDDLYEKYKANRTEMPPELIKQIELIHATIKALGLPVLMIDGVEADDVIGTIAKQAEQQGKHVLVSTSDKDLAQLVDTHITLINTMTDTILNPNTVKEKFGIPPNLIVDYLALVGDSIDNIPGIPQVGPKTAVKWLQDYGSLEKVVKNAKDIKGKVGENLRSSLDQLPLAKSLATIKLDVNLEMDWEHLKCRHFDKDALIKLFQELEFKTWLGELLEETSAQDNKKKYAKYEVITNEEAFNILLNHLSQAKLFSISVETNHNNYMDSNIVGISFGLEPGKTIYVPFGHDYPQAPNQLKKVIVLEKLRPILENDQIKKVGHNLKYDMQVLLNEGIHIKGLGFDTLLESYVLESTNNAHDINSLAIKHLSWRTLRIEDIAGKGMKQLKFNQVPIDKAAIFSSEDADVALQLHQILWPRLEKESQLKSVFEEIELPLIPVLARIEKNGVLVDGEKLLQQNEELEKRLLEIEKETYTIAGETFNINSPKQLQEILFVKMKLPVLQKTPKGQPSTADAVLQELALTYPLPKLIIEHRSLCKLITTYTKKLPEQINPKTKRIHTSYNQTGAATGRLSSSEPNLQNIPARTLEGRKIRQAFIASPGCKIISADYSQIELRIMAHIANDPGLLHAFENNLDVHLATASEVLGLPLDQVTSEQRRSAKAINFGLIYGMSAFGLAQQLGVERQAAQNYIDRYFMRYPNVKTYMENTRTTAHTTGFVETLWGRRLYLPDINSSQVMRQKAAERTAINAPLQGSAADIIKKAMVCVDDWINAQSAPIKMIMQVHDELVFEVPDSKIDFAIENIRRLMMDVAKLRVPLIVDIGVGCNWDEASEH